jgi:hypothetical protein
MPSRSALLIALLTLIGASAAPVAAAATPVVGPADGVQATRSGLALTVRFTGDSGKRAGVIGDQLIAQCARHPGPAALAFEAGDGTVVTTPGTVAADGTLQLRFEHDVPADSCELASTSSFATVARVTLTPAGDAWVDETIRATAMHALLDRAHGSGGYRPLAALGSGLVALDGPGGTPEPGQTGYWTDGAHAAVATVSAAGRRLALEDRGNGVLRTNVLQQSDPTAALVADLFGGLDGTGGSATTTKPDPETDGSRSPYRSESPLGAGDGIRGGVDGRRAAIRFTGRSAKTLRALAGRRVGIVCLTRPAGWPFTQSLSKTRSHHSWTRVARRGGVVRFTFATAAPGDLCVVSDDGTEVATATITPAGRHWVQDLAAVDLLESGSADDVDRFAPAGASAYWPTATVLAHGRKALVAMPSPGAPVAVGRVGVWTDGARQAVEATTSASGRRLFVADEGDGMVRTNLFGELSAWVLLLG